jgi:hypothetical protein
LDKQDLSIFAYYLRNIMRKLFYLLAVAVALTACSTDTEKSVSTESTLVESELGNFEAYGEVISPDSSIAAADLMAEMGNAPEFETKIKGVLTEVCQKKGCWMKVDIGNGETMRVSFKDYGFFVPTDKEKMVGKEVIFQGVAKFEKISVEDQKHFAEDAGDSKEEIDAITEEATNLSFEAVGVLVPVEATTTK